MNLPNTEDIQALVKLANDRTMLVFKIDSHLFTHEIVVSPDSGYEPSVVQRVRSLGEALRITALWSDESKFP